MKECRSRRIWAATHFFGGGGSVSAPQVQVPFPSEIKKTLGNWDQFQFNTFQNWLGTQPNFQTAMTGAQDFYKQLPGLTGPLQTMLGQVPGQYSDLYNQTGAVAGQVGGLADQVGGLLKSLPSISGLTDPFQNELKNVVNPVLQSGGALTSQGERDVSQATRAAAEQYGTSRQLGTLGTELLNRDAAQQQRLSTYTGLGEGLANTVEGLRSTDTQLRQGLLGTQGTLYGEQGGLLGQQAGILGQQGAMELGLTSGIQGLQSGALNQLTAPELAAIQGYTGLTNPMLTGVLGAYGLQNQAEIANQNASLQAALANSSSSAGKTGGAISGGSSIIGAIAPIAISAL